MRAVVLSRYGRPDGLELSDVPPPIPKADQVLVRVHAASINDWDWEILRAQSLLVRLLHGLITPRVRVIGCDIAGRVAKVGEAVNALRVGDEVYGDLCHARASARLRSTHVRQKQASRGSRPA